jgi:flagellar biosynthetic protein FliP
MRKFKNILILLPILSAFFLAESALAQNGLSSFAEGLPALKVESNGDAETTYSLSLQILALMTGLTLLPSIVLGATSFTRIIIVLSILRQAMGTQQTPPNQVLIAIALFLTFFIMTPTLTEINKTALDPYLEGELPAKTALSKGSNTLKEFLVRNTRENDLSMFTDLIGAEGYRDHEDIPLTVILPAFITSELKTAFQIGAEPRTRKLTRERPER